MLPILAAVLLGPLIAAAIPSGFKVAGQNGPLGNFGGCPVLSAIPTFPDGQVALSIPAGQAPSHILLGTGVQNYTCSASGTYTSAGAVAKLYDISCLYGTSKFNTIQDVWYALSPELKKLIQTGLDYTTLFVANHYFITNPVTGTGISPKFASAQDGGASFIVAAKVAGIHAADPANVDWLQLAKIQGDFAKTVFRVDTKAGQPPASCTPGSGPISVPYAAKYWLYV